MGNVHVVIGYTGEYDDRQSWHVAAFTSKQRATTYARRANDWLRARGLHADRGYLPNRFAARDEYGGTNPYDPGMALDYTGTSYRIVSVPLNPPLPRPGSSVNFARRGH